MGKVIALVSPWKKSLAVVVACIIASALAELVPPFVVRNVVNQDLVPHRTTGLLLAAAIYVIAVAGDAVFTFFYSYFAARVSQSAIAALRVRLFAHAAALPVSYFDRTPIGDAISRSTADVETVDELFTTGVATLVGQLVPLVATIVAMVILSPLLSAMSAVVLPPLLVATRYLQVHVRDAERNTRLAVGRLNVELSEVVGGVETLRAFGREDTFVARFRRTLRRTLRAQSESVKYNAFFAPVAGLLSSFVIALLLWVGAGHTLFSAGVSLGTLTGFILLFQNLFTPITALGTEWQSVQAAIAGAERVFELLDVPTEPAPHGHRLRAPGDTGIELEEVSFSYFGGRPVLSEVSLTVAPGEHVAIVGRTGAGKSTLVAIIGGLYAPESGVARVAGVDPRSLEDADRRRVLGVVPQSLQIFSGSVRDNLSLFDDEVPDAVLWDALRLSGLTSLISDLPDGLDTLLAGEGRGHGAVLSAGERQLLVLARAMVFEPAAVLLDEATAAIDGASDATFRAALNDFARRRGCAVLTVAHRIATARAADRVVVMEEGRVAEAGTPGVLVAAGGLFAGFAELEAAGWSWQESVASDDEDRAESFPHSDPSQS